jgi:hypothetical protein
MENLLFSFFNSNEVRVIALLIVLDVVLGIMAAIKMKHFEWAKVADFYYTNIMPYIGGFLIIYLVANYIPVTLLEGYPELANVVSTGSVTIAWLALLLNLGSSILRNFNILYRDNGHSVL